MSDDRDDYKTDYETWYQVDRECPECGNDLWSNGTIHECQTFTDDGAVEPSDCRYWEVLDE